MGAYSFGVGLGYASPAGKELTGNSTLTDKIHFDEEQNSYFVSVINIGALIGGPVGGLVMNKIGRKTTMLGSCVLFLGAWLLIGKVNLLSINKN